jgi:hypothetical protein
MILDSHIFHPLIVWNNYPVVYQCIWYSLLKVQIHHNLYISRHEFFLKKISSFLHNFNKPNISETTSTYIHSDIRRGYWYSVHFDTNHQEQRIRWYPYNRPQNQFVHNLPDLIKYQVSTNNYRISKYSLWTNNIHIHKKFPMRFLHINLHLFRGVLHSSRSVQCFPSGANVKPKGHPHLGSYKTRMIRNRESAENLNNILLACTHQRYCDIEMHIDDFVLDIHQHLHIFG